MTSALFRGGGSKFYYKQPEINNRNLHDFHVSNYYNIN